MTETINRDELNALIIQGAATVIDALPPSYYHQQHLPTAINLTEDNVATAAAAVLPDKSAEIVTYCSSPTCNNSTTVANLLTRAGYANVRTYPGGIQDSVEAGLPVNPSK